MVPLSAATATATATVAALDKWVTLRAAHRPLPHPRTGVLTDFLFTQRGRRLGYTRLRNGMLAATEAAGLRAPGGGVLIVTPHQLRHTWATEPANAGMSLQALMALLGHVTPQMTLRYATVASPTLRTAYDEAMGKMRRQFTLTPVGKPILPDKVGRLHSEMLKTLVAHGYCQRIHIIFTVAAASVVVTACGGTDTRAADKTQWAAVWTAQTARPQPAGESDGLVIAATALSLCVVLVTRDPGRRRQSRSRWIQPSLRSPAHMHRISPPAGERPPGRATVGTMAYYGASSPGSRFTS